MKHIKETEVSKRRIELLKKYYPIDEDNKVITVKLYYEHANELLDYSLGEDGCEMFKDEFLTKLSSIFEKIPLGYKADVILEIKDYDSYNPELIMDKFNDFIELNSYNAVRRKKRNQLLSAILILIGISILVFNHFFVKEEIYGVQGSLESIILQEFFDITSWVFIWQAVTVLFLSPSEHGLKILGIAKCLNRFLVSKDGNIAIEEKRDDILSKCKIDKPIKNAKNKTLLITSTALAFFGLVYLINPLSPSSWSVPEEIHLSIYIINVVQILVGISVLLAGIYGLSKFSNHTLKLGFAYPIIIIIFLILVFIWVVNIIYIEKSEINHIINLTIILLVYLGYIISSRDSKDNK